MGNRTHIYLYLWVIYLFVMSRHFIPRASQRKNKTGANDFKTPKKRNTELPHYSIRWWRKTKPHEKTDMFYISFSVENDPQNVYDSLCTEFGDNVASICNWVYWYEVLLKDELTWKDIIIRVDKAFKGKLP